MALTPPVLDDRTFQQLRDELVKRIPVYTPTWTDYNEGDPGIALLELFAYLGESLLFRFNQIPDTTRIEFLRLLGVQPRPARPSQVLLAVGTELTEGVPIGQGAEANAGAVTFQLENEVYAWPLDCAAVGKTAVAGTGTKADHDRRADALARLELASSVPTQFYETTAVPADPTAPDAVPLDIGTTLDRSLWIALLRKKTTDATKLRGRTLFVGVAWDEQIDRPFALQSLEADQAEAYRSTGLTPDPPPMLWELWNGPGETTAFTPLAVDGDTTGGMVTTGVVTLTLPKRLPVIDAAAPVAGGLDSPPPLTDEKQAANVLGWLRCSRPGTSGRNDPLHRVRWVGLNAVGAVQSRTAAAELVGIGTGDADQRYALTRHPVLPGTVALQVEESDGWHDWVEVDTFADSGPDDRHVTVDYTAGAVGFGRARVPQIGERIRVVSYRYGGGLAGNLGAGAVTAVAGTGGITVTNPLPARGGADAVSLVEALDAIPAEVHRRDRAVVADDFRELALQVTGVARAETLPLLHPDTPLVAAAGVLSVVVFPGEDTVTPDAPLPDLGLLRQVAGYLDQRRLVTTELYVIPPTYRQLSVSVGAQIRPGYQVDAVRRWVMQIIRQYLAPLPPDGPDGGGWPLGRAVRRAELEAVAVQVEGVEYLQGLLLAVPGPAGAVEVELVTLAGWEVPELVEITVVAGPPLPPGTGDTPPAPASIPVPLPPDVC